MVALRTLVADRALALVPVHRASGEVDVRWVAVSELEDPTPFLEGGELVLTTGLNTGAWTEPDWTRYLARLRTHGVGAFGLATGLTHDRVPDQLVAAARGVELDLLEVPRSTTFVAISRRVADLTQEDHARTSQDVLVRLRRLTSAALSAEPVRGVLEALAAAVGAAALLGSDGRVELGPLGPRAAGLDLASSSVRAARLSSRSQGGGSLDQTAAGTLAVYPIGLAARPSRFLATLMPHRPDDADRSLVRTSIALLGLIDEQAQVARRRDREQLGRAVELVLDGDVASARLLMMGTRFGGTRLEDAGADAVALCLAGDPRKLGEIRDELEDGFVAARVDEVVYVLTDTVGAPALAARLGEAGARVGIGARARDGGPTRAYRTAREALMLTGTSVPVARWSDVTKTRAWRLVPERAATLFSEDLLGPLSPTQVEVLETFLRCHGSRQRVATELGIHRNTVGARLAQIESVLGLSLDDVDVRASVWMALQVRAES